MKHDQRNKPQPGQTTPTAQTTTGRAQPRATSPLAGHSYAAGHALQSLHGAAPEARARPGPSSLQRDAAALHQTHGETLAQAAQQAQVPVTSLAAVVLAEQHFLPARVDERMALRFEPYQFWLATGRWLVDSHKDQAAEYRALQEAQALDAPAALQACRMGLAQISGADAALAGYASAAAMHGALSEDPGAQLRALGALAAADVALGDAMRAEDWRTVASLRAGPAAGALGYDDALAGFASSYKPLVYGDGDGDDDPAKKKRR